MDMDLKMNVKLALKTLPNKKMTNNMLNGGNDAYYAWKEKSEETIDELADAIIEAYPALNHIGEITDDGVTKTFFADWDIDLDDQLYVSFSADVDDYEDRTFIKARIHHNEEDDITIELNNKTIKTIISALDEINANMK